MTNDEGPVLKNVESGAHSGAQFLNTLRIRVHVDGQIW